MLSMLMDYENGQLEYLNLSTDEELNTLPKCIHDNDCRPSDLSRAHFSMAPPGGSEFYSFDDYESEEQDKSMDYVYNQIIRLLRDDDSNNEEHTSISKESVRSSRSLPATSRYYTDSGETQEERFEHFPRHRRISRENSDSSSSTNVDRNASQRPPIRPRRANSSMVPNNMNRRRKLTTSKSWRGPDTIQKDEFSRTLKKPESILSTLSSKYSMLPESMTESLPVDKMQDTSTKMKDNQLNSNRTEQLLNGIAELVRDESLNSIAKPARPIRRQNPLPISKSSPMLLSGSKENVSYDKQKTSLSKPSSPTNTQLVKRVTFARKGSNISQNAGESELVKLDRSEKKRNGDNFTKALFDAVEHFDFERINTLLEGDNSSINNANSNGLTVLDIAILTNHVPITKLLLKYGAKPKLLDDTAANLTLNARLQEFIQEAEQQVATLNGKLNKKDAILEGEMGSKKPRAIFDLYKEYRENEKKSNQWEFKHRLFRRMKNGFDQAGLPGEPVNVRLTVASDSSLCIKFDSADISNGAVVTRYKVEWSCSQTFHPLAGEKFITDLQNLEYEIADLEEGTAYFVRVTAWNMKGFGRPTSANPAYAVPSSWRQVNNSVPRWLSYDNDKVNKLYSDVRNSRYADDSSNSPNDSPQLYRKKDNSKKGIRGLFSSGVKFQKLLKRGVYLACVVYNEEKILTTAEDNIPMVEVDESFSGGSLQADFAWMMKVSCQWDGLRLLKQDMERLSELSSTHLRHQLLTAALQMQDMLGITDLGQLFYKPIRDNNGTTVFVTISHATEPKLPGSAAASIKWQTQLKLHKNLQPSDPLVPALSEMILYQQVSSCPVSRGLYLGYLKVKINPENIRMLVPELNPNVLPHVKIRDCPNVSQPEWQALLDLAGDRKRRADSQEGIEFKKQVMNAARRLTDSLDIPAEQVGDHRIYDVEVFEFSKDVAFIALIPPRDLVCSIHNGHIDSHEIMNRNEFLDLPMKAFEIIHLMTYQNEFLGNYARAACLVHCEVMVAEQSQREAFSNEELAITRKQTEEMKRYLKDLEEIWSETRWGKDIIAYARDKSSRGLTLHQLYQSVLEHSTSHDNGSYGRGSDSETGDTGYHSDRNSLGGGSINEKQIIASYANQNITNNNNGHYYDGEFDYHHMPNAEKEDLGPGILRVYAAYNSGLIRGTSVMLHVTPRTTAREVINLVVMQLNQAVVKKGYTSPVYTDEQLLDFCLVAVIGPRERVLRDDYKLLLLQNPWTKGRLYVRLKSNLLAALEHGQTTEV